MDIIQDVDPKLRFLVLYLDAELTTKEISHITETNYFTVQDWIRRTNRGEDIRKICKGRGRKPTFSSETKTKVVRAVRSNPEKYSTRSLASKFGMSHTTVSNILKEKGFSYRSNQIVQTLTDEEMGNRVEFCQEMLSNERILFETFYSDKMGINLSDAHRNKTWARNHQSMEIETPQQDVRINCWGAISFQGATSLSTRKL